MDLEEALAQADVYAEETEVCTIDNDLRTITVPSGLQTVGVESDEDVRRLNFQMPKQYGEVDLSAFDVRVNYLNANKEGDVYVVTDKEVSGDHMTFSWLLGRNAMAYKGTIRFIVCLKKIDEDGIVQQEFNTTVAQLAVLEGLETTEKIIQENEDLIEVILKQLDDVSGAEAKRQQAETERASAESERQKQEQERQQAIVQVTNTANEAQNTANQAQTTVTEMEKDVLKLKTEMNSAQTDIQQAQQAVQTADEKAETAQAAVDALAVRVTTAETNITQNAEAIALAATKTEVSKTLGGYYTKEQTEAAIKVESEKVTSSVSEAINKVEVGGRNLLLKTQLFEISQDANYSNGDLMTDTDSEISDEAYNGCIARCLLNVTGSTADDMARYYISDFKPGDIFTFSFWAKGSIDSFACFFYGDTGYVRNRVVASSTGFSGAHYGDGAVPMGNLSNNWTRYWVTWELDDTGDLSIPKFVLIRTDGATSGDFYVCGCKLEKGNKHTDWTPAPEDINQGINNAQSSADEAQTGLTALQARVKTAEEAIVSVQTDVETAQTTANTAKTNAATAQSTANTAKTNASNAQTTANTAVQAAADAQEDIDALLSILKKNTSGQVEFNWTSSGLGGRAWKVLWTGTWSSGTITISDLPYYNLLLLKPSGGSNMIPVWRSRENSGARGTIFRGMGGYAYKAKNGDSANGVGAFDGTVDGTGTKLTMTKCHYWANYYKSDNANISNPETIGVIIGVL